MIFDVTDIRVTNALKQKVDDDASLFYCGNEFHSIIIPFSYVMTHLIEAYCYDFITVN